MCLFIANLLFLSCKYLMGSKARRGKDMQTLTLICSVQQTSGVKEPHGLGLSGLVLGGSRVGCWGKLPETIPVCDKSQLSSKTPRRFILEQFVQDCSPWEWLNPCLEQSNQQLQPRRGSMHWWIPLPWN